MRLALTVAATLLATAAAAQDDHDHAEHEHGLGRLDVAMAGSQLRVDLTLTGAELFGEDHREEASLEDARAMLEDTASLVAVPEAAGCELSALDVVETVVEEEGDHEGHRDYTAYHVFGCASPDALTEITVTAFEAVDGLEEVHAEGLVGGRETAVVDLTAASPTLDLTQTTAARRELGAHEHGASALDVAIEGGRVEMRLESPAMDVVGFEHEPSTDEQRAAIEEARATLAEPMALFAPPEAAGCEVAEASVEHVFEGGHEEHGVEEAAEHGHEEGEEHAEAGAEHGEEEHGPEEAAAEDHGHEEEAGATHSEFQATYALDCEDPSALTAIDFPFFEVFPGAQDIDVQVVTERGQTGAEIGRESPRFDLGEVL